MTAPKIDPTTTYLIFKPVLIRAGIALIFGVLSLIIQEPTAGWVNYSLAGFFAFSGSAMWEYLRRSVIPAGMRSPLSLTAAVWMLGAISLVGAQLMEFGPAATATIAAAAFGLGGIAEIVAWAAHCKTFIPARDQLLLGAIGLVTGIVLAIEAFSDAGYHFVFGTSGATGFVIAVIAGVAGMGYFLDSRKAIKDGFTPPDPES